MLFFLPYCFFAKNERDRFFGSICVYYFVSLFSNASLPIPIFFFSPPSKKQKKFKYNTANKNKKLISATTCLIFIHSYDHPSLLLFCSQSFYILHWSPFSYSLPHCFVLFFYMIIIRFLVVLSCWWSRNVADAFSALKSRQVRSLSISSHQQVLSFLIHVYRKKKKKKGLQREIEIEEKRDLLQNQKKKEIKKIPLMFSNIDVGKKETNKQKNNNK